MDADWAKIAVDAGQFALLGVVGIYQWSSGRDRVRQEQMALLQREVAHVTEDHAQRLTRIEVRAEAFPDMRKCGLQVERITKVEQQLLHAVTREDLAEVYRAVNPLREVVAGLRSDMASMKDALSDIRRGVGVLTDALVRHNERTATE